MSITKTTAITVCCVVFGACEKAAEPAAAASADETATALSRVLGRKDAVAFGKLVSAPMLEEFKQAQFATLAATIKKMGPPRQLLPGAHRLGRGPAANHPSPAL